MHDLAAANKADTATKYQAVIFDFFDVIHQDPLRSWLERHNQERLPQLNTLCNDLDCGRINYADYVQRLADHLGTNAKQLACEFGLSTLNHEVVAIIESLHRSGYKTALLSNSHIEELAPILDTHHLWPYFNEVIISSEFGIAKPDPAIYHVMALQLAEQPTDILYIDDNPTNIASASRLGITSIHFTAAPQLIKALQSYGVKAV